MWFDENFEAYLSLIPGITLWIFIIINSRKKVNKEEFWLIIKSGFILIFCSAFVSSFIFGILVIATFIFYCTDTIILFISILSNMIASIFLFQEFICWGNIYKLEENGLTYYENRKLEKLIKKEEKRIGKKLNFETELELKHRIENERKETDIYIYSNGDEAVKIGMFYERMKKTYEHRY